MPLREKAKSLFRTKTRGDSLSKTSTNDSERDRQPSNIYKPHEMPRPKYRQPVKKEHKDKLEAFSFSDAWRKKSFQSSYSPMGTRAPSRRNSMFSLGRKSVGSKSVAGKSEGGRSNSVASAESGTRLRDGMGAAVKTNLPTEPEQEGDDDVANGESPGAFFYMIPLRLDSRPVPSAEPR